jgi:cyclic pyranopterin phosphate synthase
LHRRANASDLSDFISTGRTVGIQWGFLACYPGNARITMSKSSHFDEKGASRMVDVGDKANTHRVARASGVVRMQPSTLQMILDRDARKGDVLEVARLAGIMAAKRTADLIPLCHPLALEAVRIEFEPSGDDVLRIEATVEITGKTGVEMEALLAVSVAALTIYDMCKSVDRGMVIGPIQLEEKSGGVRGDFVRDE